MGRGVFVLLTNEIAEGPVKRAGSLLRVLITTARDIGQFITSLLVWSFRSGLGYEHRRGDKNARESDSYVQRVTRKLDVLQREEVIGQLDPELMMMFCKDEEGFPQ